MSAPSHTPAYYPPLDNLSIQPSILDVLDLHLKHNPDFPLFVFASDDGPGDASAIDPPVTEISMLEYFRAVHRAGAAIRDTHTGNSRPGEIIAIIAHLDSIVCSAIIVGMMKVGLVVSDKVAFITTIPTHFSLSLCSQAIPDFNLPIPRYSCQTHSKE
jgi:hypothetical protein